MKIAVCIYHKNAFHIYKPEWIVECIKSINDQTFQDFTLIELNYDDNKNKYEYPISLLEIGYFQNKEKIKLRKPFDTPEQAMNYIFDFAFKKYNFDICFNIHIDDIYDNTRFEKQLDIIINKKQDITISNYIIFSDTINKEININKYNINNNTFIKLKYENKKNIIDMSSLCITKHTWDKIQHICHIPQFQGIKLMKKIIDNKLNLYICNDYLFKKRIHDNQFTKKYKII